MEAAETTATEKMGGKETSGNQGPAATWPAMILTEPKINVCTWLGELYYSSCLPVVPGS